MQITNEETKKFKKFEKLCLYRENEIGIRVTLTYAQTLNGNISGLISCEESFEFTHYLRHTHQAIMVGINTILEDKPSLTTRKLKIDNPRHPVPVVLDTKLRTPIGSRIFSDGRSPIIFCGEGMFPYEKKLALEKAGAKVFPLNMFTKFINMKEALIQLKEVGIESLMVEGGGTVISNFLSDEVLRSYLSACIITISPKFSYGKHYIKNGFDSVKLKLVSQDVIGTDIVLCLHSK
eukprot:snap_masked-scaffold_15-processed-gene-6.20-mRNA-1 protein AED:0.71 eAED:0.72 QI:0/-1/0/1/-1/1/1/0/234